jgi:hypothetical protein
LTLLKEVLQLHLHLPPLLLLLLLQLLLPQLPLFRPLPHPPLPPLLPPLLLETTFLALKQTLLSLEEPVFRDIFPLSLKMLPSEELECRDTFLFLK